MVQILWGRDSDLLNPVMWQASTSRIQLSCNPFMPITDTESTRPKRAVPPYHGMNSSCTVSPWVVKSKDRPGLRPPASTTNRKPAGDEDFSSCTQDLCGRPKATHESRTQFGNPRYPDRESGPIPGGWAGPTNPLGDRLPAGRV